VAQRQSSIGLPVQGSQRIGLATQPRTRDHRVGCPSRAASVPMSSWHAHAWLHWPKLSAARNTNKGRGHAIVKRLHTFPGHGHATNSACAHRPNCRFNSDVNASHCRRLTWALGPMKINILRTPVLMALLPVIAFYTARELPFLLVFLEKTLSGEPKTVLQYAAKFAPISIIIAIGMIVLMRLIYHINTRLALVTLAIPSITIATKHALERSGNTTDTFESFAYFFAGEGMIGIIYIAYSSNRQGLAEINHSLRSLALHTGVLAPNVNEPAMQRVIKIICTGVLVGFSALFLLSPTNRFQELAFHFLTRFIFLLALPLAVIVGYSKISYLRLAFFEEHRFLFGVISILLMLAASIPVIFYLLIARI
jgi:hypothetical protein